MTGLYLMGALALWYDLRKISEVSLADVIIFQIHLKNDTGKLNAIRRKIHRAAVTKLILPLEL